MDDSNVSCCTQLSKRHDAKQGDLPLKRGEVHDFFENTL